MPFQGYSLQSLFEADLIRMQYRVLFPNSLRIREQVTEDDLRDPGENAVNATKFRFRRAFTLQEK